MKNSCNKDDIRKMVRERYADVATGAQSGCGCSPSCCSAKAPSAKEQSAKLGYSKTELNAVPEGADMGLGCGNPQAIAGLKKLGEIEHLPVADASVDVILSNCVINLSTDKEQVYREAFRVLKPGGRLAISDVVAIKPVPKAVREDFDKHSGCVAGALQVRKLEGILQAAGFQNSRVIVKEQSKEFIKDWFPGSGIEHYVRSADVQGVKPKGNEE